jgi:hypothetical protein
MIGRMKASRKAGEAARRVVGAAMRKRDFPKYVGVLISLGVFVQKRVAKVWQTVWKRFAVSRSRFSVAGDGGFSFRR